MPKSGTRYQKFLKSEKAKTKLKSKKDLPKGTNVTKTNFQVKKIIIKEQLKKHGQSEALSTRKLSVKDLLSRLNHFNTQSRIDALEGLNELVTVYSETLEYNLGQLIHGITPMVLNVEKKVRSVSLKLLHEIIAKVSVEKLDPFYNIMSTYLRSAMTHIDSRIQEDSLIFLDILIDSIPKQVTQHFHKIVPNFLDMISKLRVDSKPERILSVNLDSQITSLEWRVKVLHRLKNFFHKYAQYYIKKEMCSNTGAFETFDDTKLNNYALFNPHYVSVCTVSCFSSRNLQDVIQVDEVEKFKDYIEILIPLLFETWIEVCPNSNTDKNIETVINEDAAVLLKHILELLSLTWDLVQYFNKKNPTARIENTFCQKYRQPFNQHLIQLFPFVTNIRSKQTKNMPESEETVTDPKLTAENLEICHLFIMLNPIINIKSQNKDIVAVLNYIEKTFNQNALDKINDAIINIFTAVFSKEVTTWTKTLSIMDALLRKIIWAYFNKEMSPLFKQQIFALLCKIALNNKLSHFHVSEAYEKWLNHLPDILLEESLSKDTVDIMHKFAVKNNCIFNTVIKPVLLKVITNLPKIILSDSADDLDYHKLFSILYFIKSWDHESLNLLERQLLDNVYKNDHGKFIFDVIRLKSGNIL